jgi:hypothetical protein
MPLDREDPVPERSGLDALAPRPAAPLEMNSRPVRPDRDEPADIGHASGVAALPTSLHSVRDGRN